MFLKFAPVSTIILAFKLGLQDSYVHNIPAVGINSVNSSGLRTADAYNLLD